MEERDGEFIGRQNNVNITLEELNYFCQKLLTHLSWFWGLKWTKYDITLSLIGLIIRSRCPRMAPLLLLLTAKVFTGGVTCPAPPSVQYIAHRSLASFRYQVTLWFTRLKSVLKQFRSTSYTPWTLIFWWQARVLHHFTPVNTCGVREKSVLLWISLKRVECVTHPFQHTAASAECLCPQRDEVDAVSLDATHAFIAGKCGLVPVATEYYGKTSVCEGRPS